MRRRKRMKTDDKDLSGKNSQSLKGPKVVFLKGKRGKIGVGSGKETQVSLSSEVRSLQRVAALAKQGDKLRTEKVSRLREQISRQEYHVAVADVAKAIARSEIAWLLGKQ